MSSRVIDAVGVTGALLLIAGCGWIYGPAAPIVAGILLLTAAVLAARRANGEGE